MYMQFADHLPVDYRPEWADRFEAVADVCGTCSDFEAGRLVPVSFCPEAKRKSDELYAWLAGQAEEPDWRWMRSGDASSSVLV